MSSRALQENWSGGISALIVAAGLMAPIGIQSAFSAPDQATARSALTSPERYPDRREPVGAAKKGEINSIDFDLACLLSWHASAYAQESPRDGLDCESPAPR
jgi:hypothetical protein